MKKYMKPELEVNMFDVEDVITTSAAQTIFPEDSKDTAVLTVDYTKIFN